MEDLAASAQALVPDGERLADLVDGDLVEGLEILLDAGPREAVTGIMQSAIQLLAEDEGKKAAENVTLDGLSPLMEDGPASHDTAGLRVDYLQSQEFHHRIEIPVVVQ